MARMYPNQLQNVTSPAEARLYEAFRDQLENDYTVFHGVHWQALDGDYRPRDGEADFIIAHPQRGILILEVKGGGIRHDPQTNSWISIDRSGRSHTIKDPFYQARYSKYALQDELKKIVDLRESKINIGHAVAFPDILASQVLTGPDRPREIVMDCNDALNLSRWVGATLAHYRGQETQAGIAPGEEAVTALMDLLGKSWELRPIMWSEFRREQEQMICLTEQQYTVLDLLNRYRRALISGCAGSGKTTLAVEKAQRLARQKFRVLFTCYNKNLAADLRQKLKGNSYLDLVHFHELCYQLAEKAGVLPQKPANGDDPGWQLFFDEHLPEAAMDAADILEDTRYDAIVVDEGQDFLGSWWIPLQTLLHDPDQGILYIFFDDNQRLYDRLGDFPIQAPPFSLSINCRNTRNIHKQVMKFYQGQERPPSTMQPKGRPVEYVYFSDAEQFQRKLQSVIHQLTVEEKVPHNEVVILTPLRKKSRLWDMAGPPPLTDQWPPGSNQVYVSTIHSFKGLESSVIILVEVERWPEKAIELESLLYVGCSRARNHLIVFRPVLLPETLQKYFT
ncbi:MAG: NERD domain-containing protein [Chloroflexota bacterium]|jgi:hypothetical protein